MNKMDNAEGDGMDFVRDTLSMVRFFTRLPLPKLAFEHDIHAVPDFENGVRALPLAGALIGALGGLYLLIMSGLGLPVQMVAALTLLLMAFTTGAIHEDGLADVADGFGGGGDVARKLEIMKDSRLGTYGVMALILMSLARFSALAFLLEAYGAGAAAAALVAVSAASRAACVVPMWMLPPARMDGAGFAAARPSDRAMMISAGIAAALTLVFIGFGPIGMKRAIAALIIVAIKSFGMAEFSKWQIGGHTGDVAGATQQVTEVAFYVALLLFSDF